MMNRTRLGVGLFVLAVGFSGCGKTDSPMPTAPAPPQPPAPAVPQPAAQTLGGPLVVFADSVSGFTTTDVRDSQEQIVQFSRSGELIWVADGTRILGFRVFPFPYPGAAYIEGRICPEDCGFEVRFGVKNGEKRAYLTVNYGHWNLGTVVNVEVTNGTLVVTPTTLFPPGTFRLSGRVTEMTPAGSVPVEGASVERMMSDGWQGATSDKAGMYTIFGMYTGTSAVVVGKEGYQVAEAQVTINGDTRFDTQIVRR